jgi:hypothetical protein
VLAPELEGDGVVRHVAVLGQQPHRAPARVCARKQQQRHMVRSTKDNFVNNW